MPYKDRDIRNAKQREYVRRWREKHPEEARARVKQWRADNSEHVRAYKKRYNKEHPDGKRERAKTYHERHRQERSAKRKEHYKKTKERTLEICKQYRDTHKEQLRMYRKQRLTIDRTRLREYYRKQKIIVVEAYGGKCVCCGEHRFEFLTIDHINGGGRKDRMNRIGSSFYRWLAKNGFPKDNYRLLCMNCNFSLGKYGHCPHSTELSPVVPA